jgi:hypothetical protein
MHDDVTTKPDRPAPSVPEAHPDHPAPCPVERTAFACCRPLRSGVRAAAQHERHPRPTFVVVDVFTPHRSEHDSLDAAKAACAESRWGEDLLVLVVVAGRVTGVLDAEGRSIDLPRD